jgi:hypothetical protein
MDVCCECCVLSDRGLITRSKESYRLWCVVVCDLEISWMRRPWPTGGSWGTPKKTLDSHSLRQLNQPICDLTTKICSLENVICHKIAWLFFIYLLVTTLIFIYSFGGNLKSRMHLMRTI